MRTTRGNLLLVLALTAGTPAVQAADDALTLPAPSPVLLTAFSADGKELVSVSGDRTVCIWHLANGKELRRFNGPDVELRAVAYAPQGNLLAYWSRPNTLHVWDVRTGKELRRFDGVEAGFRETPGLRCDGLALSPDGRWLASSTYDGPITLWDAQRGKERLLFTGHQGNVLSLAFSADGKTLASGGEDYTMRLWETASGGERGRLKTESKPWAIACAPDGRSLATEEQWTVYVRGLTTKEQRFRNSSYQVPPAFSPDGRFLAVPSTERECALWELATGKSLGILAGPDGRVKSVAFSPDGRRLAIGGSGDVTLRVWDLADLRASEQASESTPPELSAEQAATSWADLEADAAKAFAAMHTLTASPVPAVAFLEKHVQPAAPLQPERIPQLIADLDSARFKTRQQAGEELEKLGELAEADLRDLLKSEPALETRRRVEQILARLQNRMVPTEELRLLRAVEVLERIGTAEARRVLQRLAGGARGSRPSDEARTALERLAVRP